MPKRKLAELNGPPRSSDTRKMSIHGTRLTQMFENGVQLLIRALKTSRGFERQKLSRREKTAKSQKDMKTLARLAEEIEALKTLNYHTVSEKYLFKQLIKTKRIAETRTFGEFQEVKKVSQDGPKNTAEANILARLFKSTPVQKEMPALMAGIRKLLRVDDAPAGKEDKKEVVLKKAPADDISDSESEGVTLKSRRGEQDSRDVEISGDESGSEDLSQFNSRLAPGSDSEDEADEESGDDDDEKDEGSNADDISDSVSRSPSPDFSAEDSPPAKKAKGVKGSTAPVKDTTFLPSLMMGGYWSGSEEATDDEEISGKKPQRKNRMGQQARRALWEKKFGAGANHVKHEEMIQKLGGRDNGWDTKRGATDGARGGRGGRRGGFGGSGRSQDRHDGHAPAGRSKPAPKKDEGPLHPSWEAKRKAKEQATTATFAGKKISFD
ncbi:uncharacterized protein N7511_001336 [Penicillium nucicola]|uniref:uncharacterized protein n=1 Tax=Penicillium nucicola TaxID=1850975 RepID=UPI0025453711|nr:uncharacterized protein N7511_001336 [Penicillium nucicola]KAJ5776325.1 hypothetical protein N7511_001336 [Penicillium nucicola]